MHIQPDVHLVRHDETYRQTFNIRRTLVGNKLKPHITTTTLDNHYNDVIMSTMASQITSFTIVYSTVYSRHRSKKTSKLRVTVKMLPFDDVIMILVATTTDRRHCPVKYVLTSSDSLDNNKSIDCTRLHNLSSSVIVDRKRCNVLQ